MHAFRIATAAGLLASGCANAQLLEPAPPPALLEARPSTGILNVAPSPYNGQAYLLNDVERPMPDYVNRMRSDPRFKFGIHLNRYLALESGYLERRDRGWHSVDATDPLDPDATDAAGGLGVRGFHTYGAAKVTLPLSDKLSAFGMLGMNYSERRGRGQVGVHDQDVDVGVYSHLGAQYKVNSRTTLNVESQNFGNTGKKWGGPSLPSGTNANWVKAALNIGL